MTDEECREVYTSLVRIVIDAGLQWIIDQVEETVILGKLVDVAIKERGNARDLTYELVSVPLSSAGILASASSSKYIQQVQDYSGRERLAMLIEAIEVAVIRADDLETATLRLLKLSDTDVSVQFVPERRNDVAFVLDTTATALVKEQRRLLSEKINLLKGAMDAS